MRFSHGILAARVFWRMGRGTPVFLSFNVTNRCNERCPMCAVPRETARELSVAELEPIFEQVRACGILVVELSGGEPFLRDDLFDIMALLDRLGLSYTVTTNGALLTRDTIARLRGARNFLQLGVSIDSLVQETYTTLRGVDCLPVVLDNVQALAAAQLPFPIKLNLTVSRLNYGEAHALLEHARARGLFLSAFPVNQGPSMAHRRGDPLLDPSDGDRRGMAGLFSELAALRRAGEPLWEYSGFYEACARYVLGEPLGPCDAGRLLLDLRSDGKLAACVDLPPFADLCRTSLSEALRLLPGQTAPIAACNTQTPCCYTCTANVSFTARHRFAFARETVRVLARARFRRAR